MKLNNGINIEIDKSYYNKAITPNKGIKCKLDMKQYPMYQLNIKKDYFDINNKEDVIENIILDLENMVNQLKELNKIDEKER